MTAIKFQLIYTFLYVINGCAKSAKVFSFRCLFAEHRCIVQRREIHFCTSSAVTCGLCGMPTLSKAFLRKYWHGIVTNGDSFIIRRKWSKNLVVSLQICVLCIHINGLTLSIPMSLYDRISLFLGWVTKFLWCRLRYFRNHLNESGYGFISLWHLFDALSLKTVQTSSTRRVVSFCVVCIYLSSAAGIDIYGFLLPLPFSRNEKKKQYVLVLVSV